MKSPDLTTETISRLLAERLPAWYRQNARDLPWRRTEDPYRIWVSEIMLQQTRVAAVLGYYARFLEVFPTVEALADAPEDRLLKLWEGLGYYSRARNLQKCARTVVERYGGRFPADYGALLALPGIGEYTAGAVASAAFGLPCPAVDGNVLRVISRLTDCHDDILDANTKRAVRDLLAAVMPEEPPDVRVFNQALMELGAVVCVPNGPPRCGACPVSDLCLGLSRGTAPSLPVKAPKKPRRTEELTVFVLLRQGKIALRRRGKTGLLAGLWEFPNVPGGLGEAEAADAVKNMGFTAQEWLEKISSRHIFTHVEWRMTGYVLRVSGPGPEALLWADGPGLQAHAVPSAFARYCAEAEQLLQQED